MKWSMKVFLYFSYLLGIFFFVIPNIASCAEPFDYDSDGDIDGHDLALFANDYQAGIVDLSDLSNFASNFSRNDLEPAPVWVLDKIVSTTSTSTSTSIHTRTYYYDDQGRNSKTKMITKEGWQTTQECTNDNQFDQNDFINRSDQYCSGHNFYLDCTNLYLNDANGNILRTDSECNNSGQISSMTILFEYDHCNNRTSYKISNSSGYTTKTTYTYSYQSNSCRITLMNQYIDGSNVSKSNYYYSTDLSLSKTLVTTYSYDHSYIDSTTETIYGNDKIIKATTKSFTPTGSISSTTISDWEYNDNSYLSKITTNNSNYHSIVDYYYKQL